MEILADTHIQFERIHPFCGSRYNFEAQSNDKNITNSVCNTNLVSTERRDVRNFSSHCLDGNGRSGRLILLYLAIKSLNVPLIISKEDRAEYMEYLAEQNIIGLASLLTKSYNFEKERITQFH